MKPARTWILVADGGQARIFLNDGPGHGVQQLPDCDYRAEHVPDREIDADRPGRTFDSGGSGRHAMEAPSSPHRESKRDFARQMMELLDKKLNAKSFDRLILVAPPQMLGDLRSFLTHGLKACLSGELAKDLTHVPQHEVAPHLEEILAV